MPTIHPVKLLALAYGLMPELRQLLDRPARGADSKMRVAVKLFAAARELAGGGEVDVELPDGATVGDAAARRSSSSAGAGAAGARDRCGGERGVRRRRDAAADGRRSRR